MIEIHDVGWVAVSTVWAGFVFLLLYDRNQLLLGGVVTDPGPG